MSAFCSTGPRLLLGAILGEILGAATGAIIAPRRPVEAPVAFPEPSYGIPSDEASDHDDSDPLVVWPLCGAAGGFLAGLGAVGAHGALREALGRRGGGRTQPRARGTGR